jgi:putative Mg2+ transporter-C (MgtC) family protein
MNFDIETVIRLLVAAALGALIGFEREREHKPAGLRTHILISLGSALFTVISIYGFSGSGIDQSRVAAGIVTGIGFLGAGVILHGVRGHVVLGLTTAASIWATAAVGMAVGTGMYLIAAAAAVIIFLILLIPNV